MNFTILCAIFLFVCVYVILTIIPWASSMTRLLHALEWDDYCIITISDLIVCIYRYYSRLRSNFPLIVRNNNRVWRQRENIWHCVFFSPLFCVKTRARSVRELCKKQSRSLVRLLFHTWLMMTSQKGRWSSPGKTQFFRREQACVSKITHSKERKNPSSSKGENWTC